MSKELTPLQALKDLREDAKHHLDSHIEYLNERLDVFENTLKENERLKCSCLENLLNEESKDYVRKKLYALDIIKYKWVNVDNFINRINRDTYYKEYKRLCGLYKIMVFSATELTEYEYDLLKEVLL